MTEVRCWHCGGAVHDDEPIGVTADGALIEALVCGRRWCRPRAKFRDTLRELLAALGA